MYAQQQDALRVVRDPIQIYVSLPDEETGHAVYVDQLAFYDLIEMSEEVEMSSADETGEESQNEQTNGSAPAGTSPSSGAEGQITLYSNDANPGPQSGLVPVLVQTQNKSTNESFIAYVNEEALNDFTGQAEIQPDSPAGQSLDMERLAREVYRQIKRRIQDETQRGRTYLHA